jgi:hypothetical protein
MEKLVRPAGGALLYVTLIFKPGATEATGKVAWPENPDAGGSGTMIWVATADAGGATELAAEKLAVVGKTGAAIVATGAGALPTPPALLEPQADKSDAPSTIPLVKRKDRIE